MFTPSSAIIFVTLDSVSGVPQSEPTISVRGLLDGVLELAGGLDRDGQVGLRVNDQNDRALHARCLSPARRCCGAGSIGASRSGPATAECGALSRTDSRLPLLSYLCFLGNLYIPRPALVRLVASIRDDSDVAKPIAPSGYSRMLKAVARSRPVKAG